MGKGFNPKGNKAANYDKLFSLLKRRGKGFLTKSHSRNRNPNAIRSSRYMSQFPLNGTTWDGPRQTYQGRNYEGVNGKYSKEDTILVRYNIDDIVNGGPDSNFINSLLADIEEIQEKISEYDEQTLLVGKETCEAALKVFTPIDTGELVSGWRVSVDVEAGTITMENDVEYMLAQNYGRNIEDNPDANGGKQGVAWYPGYYMMEKAEHRALLKMEAFDSYKRQQLKGEYSGKRN